MPEEDVVDTLLEENERLRKELAMSVEESHGLREDVCSLCYQFRSMKAQLQLLNDELIAQSKATEPCLTESLQMLAAIIEKPCTIPSVAPKQDTEDETVSITTGSCSEFSSESELVDEPIGEDRALKETVDNLEKAVMENEEVLDELKSLPLKAQTVFDDLRLRLRVLYSNNILLTSVIDSNNQHSHEMSVLFNSREFELSSLRDELRSTQELLPLSMSKGDGGGFGREEEEDMRNGGIERVVETGEEDDKSSGESDKTNEVEPSKEEVEPSDEDPITQPNPLQMTPPFEIMEEPDLSSTFPQPEENPPTPVANEPQGVLINTAAGQLNTACPDAIKACIQALVSRVALAESRVTFMEKKFAFERRKEEGAECDNDAARADKTSTMLQQYSDENKRLRAKLGAYRASLLRKKEVIEHISVINQKLRHNESVYKRWLRELQNARSIQVSSVT